MILSMGGSRYRIVFVGAYSRLSTRAVFMPNRGHNQTLGLSIINQAHFSSLHAEKEREVML